MGCAIEIVRYLVFFANFIFAIGGIALLAIGILYKLNITEFTEAIPKEYDSVGLAPTFVIVIGCIIFFIAFFGCCGAFKESTCMLTTYATILLIILILQIAIAVFAFLSIKNSDEDTTVTLQNEIKKNLEEIFGKYPAGQTEETVNVLQKELKCCGVDGPQYWWEKIKKIPGTCCDKEKTETCSTAEAYKDGCSKSLYDFIVNVINVIGYVVITIAVTEVIGIIFALCLSSSIRNKMRRGYA